MKKKLFIVILLLLSTKCAQTQYRVFDPNLKIRLSSLKNNQNYQLKRSFNVKHRRFYLLWGTIPVENKSLEELLRNEIREENHIIADLQIVEEYDPIDGLIDTIIFGLVRPYSVNLYGNIYTPKSSKEEPNEVHIMEKETDHEKTPI